jgi:hypothetical protein
MPSIYARDLNKGSEQGIGTRNTGTFHFEKFKSSGQLDPNNNERNAAVCVYNLASLPLV